MPETASEAPIHSDPNVCGGTTVFKGTRVFVETLFDYLRAGQSIEDFLHDFPSVSQQQVIDLLWLAENRLNLILNDPVARRELKRAAQADATSA